MKEQLPLSLKGKRAWVGGASAGIGAAIAAQLAAQGASIILAARSEEALRTLAKTLTTDQGQQHLVAVVDYSQLDDLHELVKQHSDEEQVHIVINNTGGPPPGLAHQSHTRNFQSAMMQHLYAAHEVTTGFIPGMKEAGYGRIINIISTSVKQPLPNLGVSNTVRGAVANWAKTLANELGQYHITVNNILPGATATGRLSSIISNKAEKTGEAENEVAAHMQNQIPLRRFAKPEEIAYAAGFLASEAGAYINGINLPVDGGRTSSL